MVLSDFTIISPPEIYNYWEESGFYENSSRIESNEILSVLPNTFLVNNKWLKAL